MARVNESSKANMTDRLSTAESDNDRENIQREYDAALDRILIQSETAKTRPEFYTLILRGRLPRF